MNREIRDEWIRDLRSGEYTQGYKRLKTPNGYCCLGVLCEQAVRKGIILPPVLVNTCMNPMSWAYDNQTSYPSTTVLRWADLADQDGIRDIILSPEHQSLVYYNDVARADFSQIALLIEEYL